MARRESHIVSILYRTAVGYALHNGVPASVSSFEAPPADLLFMYERVRTTATRTHTAGTRYPRVTHSGTHHHCRGVVVATLSPSETVNQPEGCPRLEDFSGFHDDATRRETPKRTRAEEEHIHRNRQRALSAAVKAIFRQSSSFYREYVISGHQHRRASPQSYTEPFFLFLPLFFLSPPLSATSPTTTSCATSVDHATEPLKFLISMLTHATIAF